MTGKPAVFCGWGSRLLVARVYSPFPIVLCHLWSAAFTRGERMEGKRRGLGKVRDVGTTVGVFANSEFLVTKIKGTCYTQTSRHTKEGVG